MDLGPRGKQLFQRQCGLADELHRHQFGLEHRHASVVSGGEELRFRTDAAAQHHARNLVAEEFVVALFPKVRLDGPQVGSFDGSEHLHPLVGEVTAESGQGQARAVHGGLLDEPVEEAAAGQEFQSQRSSVVGVEFLDGDVGRLHERRLAGVLHMLKSGPR